MAIAPGILNHWVYTFQLGIEDVWAENQERANEILLERSVLTATDKSAQVVGFSPAFCIHRTKGPLVSISTAPPGVTSVGGPQFYVSPTGSAGGDGSIGNPWDWPTVLNSASPPAAIVAGSTVWVRGGTYTIDRTGIGGDMTITTVLHGTASNPIIVRAYTGERPVFSVIRNPTGNTTVTWILGGGDYTWFWGIEWQSPSAAWTNGRTSINPSSDNPSDVNGAGFVVRINSGDASHQDVGTKMIHCIIHDTTSNGSSSQQPGGVASESYGNVVFNNGWVGSDRAHQHGTYNQNSGTNPRKFWESNVVLSPFGDGAQFFGTSTPAQNIEADDNIIGGANTWSTQFASGELFEVSNSLDNLAFLRNLTWLSRTRNLPQWGGRVCSFGSQLTTNEGSINIQDNVLFSTTGMSGFSNLTFRHNRCVGGRTGTPGNEVWIVEYYRNPAVVESVNLNEYYNAGNSPTPFNRYLQGGTGLQQLTFAQWQSSLGFDASGLYSSAVPTTNWVYVKPTTRYEANRGHVVIYNWQGLSSQNVDLSSILNVGQSYVIWDLWSNPRHVGAPLASGVYAGGTVAFALATRTAPTPTGWGLGTGEAETLTNENEFHVFLVRLQGV